MLTDFGTARSVQQSMAGTMTMCGTPFYMAAEQVQQGKASPATDVHAVSLIIYEVLCAPRPVRKGRAVFELMRAIVSGELPPMRDVPPEIARILTPAFNPDPKKRPTAAQMVKNLGGVCTVYGLTT